MQTITIKPTMIMHKYISNLLDNNNKELWRHVNLNWQIEIIPTNSPEHSCYVLGRNATIYIPINTFHIPSFTHELLHLYIKKHINVGQLIANSLNSDKLINIFSTNLVDHLSNCLEHVKMLPIFIELGYNVNDFILDFDANICDDFELESFNLKIHNNMYVSLFIDMYIGKHFSILCTPNKDIDYSDCLNKFRKIDEDLYSINLSLFDCWKNTDILNKQNVFIINNSLREYFFKMNNWIKDKNLL